MAMKTAKQLVAAVKKFGTLKAAARNTGTGWTVTHKLYTHALAEGLLQALPMGRSSKQAVVQLVKPVVGGRRKALKAKPVTRHPDKTTRFLFTCAQNNTKLHEDFWNNLLILKEFYRAELHISRFAYIKSGLGARGDKQNYFAAHEEGGENFKAVKDFWFDSRIVPFVSDDRREIAPGLIWCGEANILPTAQDPLGGLETFTGRASGIFPHVKIEMNSIPSGKFDPVKFNYTTGTITLRNYIQRKEGLKAEFHHCYGALLVEVEPSGDWWVRQLNADSEGTIYDIDVCVQKGKIRTNVPAIAKRHSIDLCNEEFVEGIKWGDIHEYQMDDRVRQSAWGKDGVLDYLHPRYQFMDDTLDFFTRSHHEIDDPHAMLERFVAKRESVEDECDSAARFLIEEASRDFCETVVVNSNHDRALLRWLKNKNAQHDPVNMAFWHRLNARITSIIMETGDTPIVLREAFLDVLGLKQEPKGLKFLAQGDSFIICPQAGGGIENGQHGDDGANGAYGSTASFAKMGRKMNKGHDHKAAIRHSVYSTGCCLDLDNPPKYQHGPSSASNSHVVTYVNGKRAIITMWGEERKAWADR